MLVSVGTAHVLISEPYTTLSGTALANLPLQNLPLLATSLSQYALPPFTRPSDTSTLALSITRANLSVPWRPLVSW